MKQIKLFLIFSLLTFSFIAFSQTAPQPFPLANTDLIFQGFSDPTIEEYPPFMAGWAGDHYATTETAAPGTVQGTGDFPLSAQGAKTLAQISNQGSGGISIKAGCDADANGAPLASALAIAIALDTRGATGISVTWTGHLISDAPNVDSRVQLQYRVGTAGPWTNVAGHNYQATTGAGIPSTRFGPTTLPSAIENKPVVQFRWFMYQFQQGVAFFCNGDHARIDSVKFTATAKVPQKPDADFVVSNGNPSKGEPINFTDKSSGLPTSWAWDFGDGTIDSVQNPLKAYTNDGIYTVQLIATNGVGSDTMIKTDYITVGTVGIAGQAASVFAVYPNPATSLLYVKAPSDIQNPFISVYNLIGEEVFTGVYHDMAKPIDLSALPGGMYILQIKHNNGVYSSRFSLIN